MNDYSKQYAILIDIYEQVLVFFNYIVMIHQIWMSISTKCFFRYISCFQYGTIYLLCLAECLHGFPCHSRSHHRDAKLPMKLFQLKTHYITLHYISPASTLNRQYMKSIYLFSWWLQKRPLCGTTWKSHEKMLSCLGLQASMQQGTTV